jgi:hypothetical protein
MNNRYEVTCVLEGIALKDLNAYLDQGWEYRGPLSTKGRGVVRLIYTG